MRRLVFIFPILLLLLSLFVSARLLFAPANKQALLIPVPKKVSYPKVSPLVKTQPVVTEQIAGVQTTNIPENFLIDVLPRRQKFNLSCEFASAGSIIYEFTKDPFFAPGNEEESEKRLMESVGVSQNPNIGIRMGTDSSDNLLTNLMQRFGGTEYYGIHAPPFIELFAEFGLLARPLEKTHAISQIQQEISGGNLVMVWIKIGFGTPVDVALSYGQTKVVKGEHSLVIHGYDAVGVFAMDPASGKSRHISYDDFVRAMESFDMPLLAITPASQISTVELYTPSLGVDTTTGLDRKNLRVTVENGTGKFGQGSTAVSILRDFGYSVVALRNAQDNDFENVTIRMKESVRDYQKLVSRDFQLASYTISSMVFDLPEENDTDAVIVVGD